MKRLPEFLTRELIELRRDTKAQIGLLRAEAKADRRKLEKVIETMALMYKQSLITNRKTEILKEMSEGIYEETKKKKG